MYSIAITPHNSSQQDSLIAKPPPAPEQPSTSQTPSVRPKSHRFTPKHTKTIKAAKSIHKKLKTPSFPTHLLSFTPGQPPEINVHGLLSMAHDSIVLNLALLRDTFPNLDLFKLFDHLDKYSALHTDTMVRNVYGNRSLIINTPCPDTVAYSLHLYLISLLVGTHLGQQ